MPRRRRDHLEPRRPASTPCPCCGHVTLTDPGEYDLCPVCFWEDDPEQLRWPNSTDGANGVGLIESQHEYARTGSMHLDYRRKVRAARTSEPLDQGWRPINLEVDEFEPSNVQVHDWPDDLTQLYWWRPTFWSPMATD